MWSVLGRGPNLCSLSRQEYENLFLQFDVFFEWLVQLVNLHFAVLRSPDFLLQSNVVLITALLKPRHSTCVLRAVLPFIFHINMSNLLTLPPSSLAAVVREIENPRGVKAEYYSHSIFWYNVCKLEKRIIMSWTQSESVFLVWSCGSSVLCINSDHHHQV